MKKNLPSLIAKTILPAFAVLTISLSVQPTHLEAQVVTKPAFSEKKISEWKETKTSKEPMKIAEKSTIQSNETGEAVLYDNNGLPINTNIISEDTENIGNEDLNLFAVTEYTLNGTEYQDYYLANVNTIDLNEIKNSVTQNIMKMKSSSLPIKTAVAGAGSYVRNYYWSFYTSGTLSSKLSASVELTRGTSSANINGVSGSVWDVKSISQIENVLVNPAYNEWIQRLSANFGSQTLLDWGPEDSTSSSTVSVGLSGIIPSVSWTFGLTGFSIDDTSSKSSKYGRWILKNRVTNLTPKSAAMRPGIRVTNTSGNLGIEMSHVYTRAGGRVHQTGVN